MEVEALVAHSGQILKFQASDYATGDEFRAALSQLSTVPAQYIVALTPQGKALRLQDVPMEERIYIYDIRINQPASAGRTLPKIEITVPRPYTVADPPNRINDAKSQESWQELFRTRQEWVERVVDDCAKMAQTAEYRYREMEVMTYCIDGAIMNLEAILLPLKPKYDNLKTWMQSAQPEYNMLVTRWEAYLSLARSIPIDAAVAEFMTERNMSSKNRMGRQTTLEDLLDLDTVKRTGRQAPQALRRFNQRVNDMEKFATRTFQNLEDTMGDFEELMRRSALDHADEPRQLLEDIDAVAKAMEQDYQATLNLSNSPKDLAQASKMAARYTERILPTIKDRATEMDGMLQHATKARNALALESVEWMRGLTELTTQTTQLRTQINGFDSDEELSTFDYLRLIQQVPYMYASFAVEALRRRTWYANLEEDATGVTEDVAHFQKGETERRKKWLKTVDNLYSAHALSTSSVAAVLEINMLGQEKQWPAVNKRDLVEFHETLQRQRAEPAVIKDVGDLIEGLNKPTKLQMKRVKAFKNGSIHESALGRSGLMIRGDNEVIRVLQDDKQRLESKLKTAESRVKRLETVLHDKSTAAMPPSFQALLQQSGQSFATGNDSPPATQKVAHDRRRSSMDLPANVIQRIQQLEVELNAEKDKSAIIEEQLTARTKALATAVSQMEDANSTKTDLLKNMDAQKRESIEVQKSLDDEIKQLKDQIEEHEDRMYNVDESREHAKAGYDTRIQGLQDQIAKLTKERSDDALKSVGQVEFLRNETRLQREQIDNLEKKLKSSHDENKTISKRLYIVDQTVESLLQALQDIHSRLAPGESTPADHGDLVESVLRRCDDMLEKIHNIEGDMSVTKSELDEAQTLVKGLRAEKSRIEELLVVHESAARQLRENLGEEAARVGALEGELDESRKQLSELRSTISDGETGSDSLRKKLEEEEIKVTTMTENLASKQSQVGSLEEELRLYKAKLAESQEKLGILKNRFVSRTEQAKDLTQKLYTQNDRLGRLLERMGFSINRENGVMTIQRVPRAERSKSQSEGLIDPEASIRRSGTLSKSPDSSDLELLYWMNNPDQATEIGKFQAFMSELGAFDMDAFTETVYKRVKDIEHLARKLQREARSYREKAHAFQKIARDRIAYKNFKEGDLALFLPTRNEQNGAWAAFNVNQPHHFLREQEAHGLSNKDYLLARIQHIQEYVVDMSKSQRQTGPVIGADNNPYDLSDGVHFWCLDANEDKPGAPSTPGLGKTTVAANKVDAVAEKSHARNVSGGQALGLVSRSTGIDGVSKTLSKSLESRRSSTSSRRALPFGIGGNNKGSALASEANSVRAAAADSPDAAAAAESRTAAEATNGADPGPSTSVAERDEQQSTRDGSQAPERARHLQLLSQALTQSSKRPMSRSQILRRDESGGATPTPGSLAKKCLVWDSLWSLDYSYGKRAKARDR